MNQNEDINVNFRYKMEVMESLKIEILNPKAEVLLRNLADLKLIKIEKSLSSEFSELLQRLRNKSKTSMGMDDITNEVEAVRKERYDG